MKYNTILLDADGTLLDFLAGEDAAVRRTMKLSGIEPNDELVRTYSEINDGFWKMLERGEVKREELLYKRFEVFCERFEFDADAKEMSALYKNELGNQGQTIDGAKDFLSSIFGKAKMYIVTNGVAAVQNNRLNISGITEYIDEVFISGHIGYEKPDVRYFQHVAEHIDCFDKSKTVIIGDSLTSDIKGGINFGIDTCWYNPEGKPTPEDMNITCVARDFDDILDFLFKGEDK